MEPKTASEMIFAKYYIEHDEILNTYCVYQHPNFDTFRLRMVEYTDKAAAEYICNELNNKADLEVEE